MPRLSSKEESKGPAPSQFMPRLSSKEESKKESCLCSVAKKKANGFEPGIFRFAPLLVKEEIKASCPRREDPAPSQFMPRLSSKEESKQSYASVQWQRRKQTDSNQESFDLHLFSSTKRSRLLVKEERTLHHRKSTQDMRRLRKLLMCLLLVQEE